MGRHRDPHLAGTADDVYARGPNGKVLADWLLLNHQVLGVQYILYSSTQAIVHGGVMRTNFVDRRDHDGHVHFELSRAGGLFNPQEMQAVITALGVPARP